MGGLRWTTLLLMFGVVLAPRVCLAEQDSKVRSPNGRVQVEFQLSETSRPTCFVSFDCATVAMVKFGLQFRGEPPISSGMRLRKTKHFERDRRYTIPVGKTSAARDWHRELIVAFENHKLGRPAFDLVVRVFDEGVAFRYLLNHDVDQPRFELVGELTEWSFEDDPVARLLPLDSYTTSYEKYYETTPISRISTARLIGLPMLLERKLADDDSIWVAITEANLQDYAGLYLACTDPPCGTFAARLSPLPGRSDCVKVVGNRPHRTPWRVLMIADDPGQLIESNLVFHLNEPSKIADLSWIVPGKTTLPWWNGYVLESVDFQPGLNTATHKHYLNFCAEHGIETHCLDGTETAWYGGPIEPEGPTDVTTAVPDLDLPELFRYAREKGVRLRLWVHWRALRAQLDEALATYRRWGAEGIMVDFMDRDDQEMVNFYHKVAEKAAAHRLTVSWHGCYKPTGMERTWPNVLAYEGALSQEYNKWQGPGTFPKHHLDVAFVRMLAGPVDFHQGGMRNVLPTDFKTHYRSPLVQGTRGHQLAMYVVYQNHLPMLVDYPDAYAAQDGFKFLAEVPTTWDETRVLVAEIDRCLVLARRRGSTWYLGGMTADVSRALQLKLSFLEEDAYHAKLFLDDSATGPTKLITRKETFDCTSALNITMPANGGFTAIIRPVESEVNSD